VENLGGVLFFIALFAWVPLMDWVDSRKKLARKQVEIEARKLAFEKQKMDFEAQKLMLEKCQSTEEVSQFLATDAGKRLLERFKGKGDAPAVKSNPLSGIIALIVFGALFGGLGLAFFLLTKFTSHPGLIIPAFLFLIPGLGLFIGAAVSYHLKKKWGLLEREPTAPSV
jgi:hypothetical protein